MTNTLPTELQTLIDSHVKGFNDQDNDLFLSVFGDTAIIIDGIAPYRRLNPNAPDQWTVPINLLFSKVATFGPFPASYQIGFGGYAAHPEGGPTWKLRGAIVLLLPRRK